MKIPAISTQSIGHTDQYKNEKQTNDASLKNNFITNDKSPFVSDSYGRAMVNMNNSPNFGFVLTGAFIAGILATLLYGGALIVAIYNLISSINFKTNVDEDKREKVLEDLMKEYKTDIEKISRSMGKDKKEAEKYYNSYLQASYIKQKKGEETGMNAVMGYTLEKYKIIKDVLSPMVLAQQTIEPKVRELVPNGILLYGPPGTGKTYIAEKIGEHMKHFGTNVVNLDINSLGYDEESKIELIEKTFNNARQNFEDTGKYTIININDLAGTLEKRQKNSTPKLLDTILQNLDNSAKRGVVALISVNDPEELDRALLRKGRVDIKMPIGKMEKFENAEMINFALYNNHATREYAGSFDYQKVVDEMEKNQWAFTPAEFFDFVRQMGNDKNVSADSIIALMKDLTGNDGQKYNDAELSPERRQEFREKIAFVDSIYNTPPEKLSNHSI